MSHHYDKEGSKLKIEFRKKFDEWAKEFYDGTKIRSTPSNPGAKGITYGRSMRGLQSLIMSPDSVHLDYLDKRLTKGASVKSIMGGLGGRVQKTSQGSTSPYAPLPTDTLHHKNVLDAYDPITKQKHDVLHDFLIRSEDAGEFYGDSKVNLEGHSTDARSHTGGRGKKGKLFNPTAAGEGADGVSALSMHPRGTADKGVKLPDREYSSGKEMFEEGARIRKIHANDTKIGIASDTPRRAEVNRILQKEGIIKEGVDVYGKGTSADVIAQAKKFFSGRNDLLSQVARHFDPSLAKNVKQLGIGGLIPGVGIFFDGLDAKAKHDKASKPDANWLDKLQSKIAKSTVATSVSPDPWSQGFNFLSGLVNTGIDMVRDPTTSKPLTDNRNILSMRK
jgi:hypothetical protein